MERQITLHGVLVGASATKEVPVARPITITAEEAKYVVDKTQLEAIGNLLPTDSRIE